MCKLTTNIDDVTYIKLVRRARRIGMKVEDATRMIAIEGAAFFLRKLVGATNSRAKV